MVLDNASVTQGVDTLVSVAATKVGSSTAGFSYKHIVW